MRFRIILNGIVINFSCTFLSRQAQFNIIGKKAVCSKESELVHNVTCGLTALNRTASLWSIDVNFDDDVVIDSIYVSEIVYFRLFRDDQKSHDNDFSSLAHIELGSEYRPVSLALHSNARSDQAGVKLHVLIFSCALGSVHH